MKFYAVKQGRQVGIFETWAEAEQQVKGYSGAKFKSFTSREDAESYLSSGDLPKKIDPTLLQAFVDGSFDKTMGVYGSGVVLLKNNQVLEHIAFAGDNPNYVESYQIAGEVFATLKAMAWGIEHGYTEIEICYDYEGIRAWALNDWKTNKSISKAYKEEFDVLATKIAVQFTKVKAHSGIKYNELADGLAKQAIKNYVV